MEKDSSEDAYALMYAGQKIEQLQNEVAAQQKKVAIAVALIRYSVRLHAEKTASPTFWRDFWAVALTHIEQTKPLDPRSSAGLSDLVERYVDIVLSVPDGQKARFARMLAAHAKVTPDKQWGFDDELTKTFATLEELVRRAVALVSSSDPMTRADVDFVEDAQKALGEP